MRLRLSLETATTSSRCRAAFRPAGLLSQPTAGFPLSQSRGSATMPVRSPGSDAYARLRSIEARCTRATPSGPRTAPIAASSMLNCPCESACSASTPEPPACSARYLPPPRSAQCRDRSRRRQRRSHRARVHARRYGRRAPSRPAYWTVHHLVLAPLVRHSRPRQSRNRNGMQTWTQPRRQPVGRSKG
jgi:hypothetical protein